jgi:hypothetical protein
VCSPRLPLLGDTPAAVDEDGWREINPAPTVAVRRGHNRRDRSADGASLTPRCCGDECQVSHKLATPAAAAAAACSMGAAAVRRIVEQQIVSFCIRVARASPHGNARREGRPRGGGCKQAATVRRPRSNRTHSRGAVVAVEATADARRAESSKLEAVREEQTCGAGEATRESTVACSCALGARRVVKAWRGRASCPYVVSVRAESAAQRASES